MAQFLFYIFLLTNRNLGTSNSSPTGVIELSLLCQGRFRSNHSSVELSSRSCWCLVSSSWSLRLLLQNLFPLSSCYSSLFWILKLKNFTLKHFKFDVNEGNMYFKFVTNKGRRLGDTGAGCDVKLSPEWSILTKKLCLCHAWVTYSMRIFFEIEEKMEELNNFKYKSWLW